MDKKLEPVLSLNGSIEPPADKSISQRAAIFSLLHDGVSEVKNYSPAEDPQSTLRCIQDLGAKVTEDGGVLFIEGTGRNGIQAPDDDLDCGNSGTAMRLLSGVITGAGVTARLCGDSSLTSRTMTRIIEPLEQMGAHILARNSAYAPLMISRLDPLKPMNFELPIPSAQLKSCMLLAGLFGETPTRVIESIPSRDHTERLLRLKIEEEGDKRIIHASREDQIPNQNYTIPGDFSAAAFWMVAGCLLPQSEIRLENTGMNPTRNALLHLLQQMGASFVLENERTEGAEPVADIVVRTSDLRAINVPRNMMPNCIDELPILAVAMVFAEGVSVISGAEELRHKETDRIMAIAEMLRSIGANFKEMEDGLEIYGNPDFTFEGATFKSFHDHRIAMASAVLALKGESPSTILDAECAAVSYPNFWEHLEVLS
ncbi:3-phosphoshikimate 1-carboxyvinyltransferase [Balneola vulgaris]|uniref:3-phosphoshikimate 1-carboxyvinyltransferase n=1 Tax=Balneola vulgaris TaxID=287535 RepID=UPI00037BD26D|nr:3-phosphoshikimate 1-carboxyvinyltransferase [Balneola vulgaris]